MVPRAVVESKSSKGSCRERESDARPLPAETKTKNRFVAFLALADARRVRAAEDGGAAAGAAAGLDDAEDSVLEDAFLRFKLVDERDDDAAARLSEPLSEVGRSLGHRPYDSTSERWG